MVVAMAAAAISASFAYARHWKQCRQTHQSDQPLRHAERARNGGSCHGERGRAALM